jgi:hypothetical protein
MIPTFRGRTKVSSRNYPGSWALLHYSRLPLKDAAIQSFRLRGRFRIGSLLRMQATSNKIILSLPGRPAMCQLIFCPLARSLKPKHRKSRCQLDVFDVFRLSIAG